MRILLHDGSRNSELSLLYDKALGEAVELLIVSAYLTDWSPPVRLRDDLCSLVFIVGKDFGITRKAACEAVLKWLPKRLRCDFLAADKISGFHPKLVAWQSVAGEHHLVLGSSNLTEAAFSSNYEANVYERITLGDFQRLREWVWAIRARSTPISEDWLDAYREAPVKGGKKGAGKSRSEEGVIQLKLPRGLYVEKAVKDRRKGQKAFSEIRKPLVALITKCAQGKLGGEGFYDRMKALWGSHDSRFQGNGFQIKGKNADWGETCRSLHAILTKSESCSVAELDQVVRIELDRLSDAANTARGSWLSEMLCHFFPDRYPLLNEPVRSWLKYRRFRAPRGASEGSIYIDLALKLRAALGSDTDYAAKNLAELDGVLWAWWAQRKKRRGQK